MDKLIYEGNNKAIISNDGATILRQLDIVHPAARTLVDIAKSQDEEVTILNFDQESLLTYTKNIYMQITNWPALLLSIWDSRSRRKLFSLLLGLTSVVFLLGRRRYYQCCSSCCRTLEPVQELRRRRNPLTDHSTRSSPCLHFVQAKDPRALCQAWQQGCRVSFGNSAHVRSQFLMNNLQREAQFVGEVCHDLIELQVDFRSVCFLL